MAIEILGLGILSPYFGTALLVSSNVIGVVLFSAALGYIFGGRRADKAENPLRHLLYILFFSALWIGAVFPFRNIIGNFIGWMAPYISLGSFIASVTLFFVPSALLGAALPYAIKCFVRDIESSGRVSGMLYGISAAGSIIGTFFIGFFMLPFFGADISFAFIFVLLLVCALSLGANRVICASAATISLPLFFVVDLPEFAFHRDKIFSDGRINIERSTISKLDEAQSIFSRIQIYEAKEKDTNRAMRIMYVNGEAHSATYLDSNDLVFNYARYNRLGGHFNPAAKRALLVGGGGYSYANYFLTDTPLYDVEKVWKLAGNLYHNNKTISLPVLMSDDQVLLSEKRSLVYQSTSAPTGRAAVERTKNHLDADNQEPHEHVVVRRADILDTGFSDPRGYVHIHETNDDGTPGRIISPDIPLKDYIQRPRSIVGKSALISGENKNVSVPLDRPAREGEVLYPMLHRDNGNGVFDNFLVDGYEQIEALDVVEIDPRTTDFAEKYFHLNRADPRLRIFHEDGRTYLNRTKDKYDIVYLDAFRSFYSVPWQLTTIEATKKIYEMLNENGVVVANVPAAIRGRYGKFFQAEYKTYQQAFPEVRAYATFSPTDEERIQNMIIVAFKSKDNIRETPNDDPEINEQLTHRWVGAIGKDAPILTDNFAPTDYYTSKFANIHSF